MKNITKGNNWIRIDDERIQINAIARYQVAGNELKIYLLSGEIFKITLGSEGAKNYTLQMLDEMCQIGSL